MELVTTHVGADFDGLASMLVARRLYPEARLFFPGAREASVRRMLAAGHVRLEEVRQREVDPARLTRIVLCDTRQRARLGVVGRWLESPGIEVVAFDHHPDNADDVPATSGRVDAGVGALSTLMLEELLARGLEPSTDECRALLLGIYEDTGALTHVTTTARDADAVAWLLRHGGDLAGVRQFAGRGLDAERVGILHRMTEALEIHPLHGVRAGLIALELERHVEELAPLVSRCLEMLDLRVLVALFAEPDRITAIGRGDLPGFDLGDWFRAFCGGGGHATAAAGGLRAVTLVEARERALALLSQRLPRAVRARDVMVREVRSVVGSTPIGEAKRLLNAARVNAMPVLDAGGGVSGVVTRQALDAALQHRLEATPVAAVADGDMHWASADAPIDELATRLARHGPRLILIGDGAQRSLEGVVTRAGVLRALYPDAEPGIESAERRAREHREGHRPAKALLADRLSESVRLRLGAIADEARLAHQVVCLVGGGVRDLLLEREVRDLDLVVVGDGIEFARRCARRLGAVLRVHETFLTAVLEFPDGETVDVASARSDFYRAPAALPEVQTSALRQDLYRRDFTVNTLAIRLGPDREPQLLDYFGGRRDLADKSLRVLHSLSFVDDPTRAFRAVRLEQRLGFRLSLESARLLRVALTAGAFELLSGSRLREELLAICADPATALAALDRLAELHLLAAIDPELVWTPDRREAMAAALAALDWWRVEHDGEVEGRPEAILLAALAATLPGSEATTRLGDRLLLAGDLRQLVLGGERRAAAATALERSAAPSEVSAALAACGTEDLLLLLATAPPSAREAVRRELTVNRALKLRVFGRDLLARGLPPGPHLGVALLRTREARLDGRIGPTEELEFAAARAREQLAEGEK